MLTPLLSLRRLLPVLLLAGFTLASCAHGKDRDPHPKGKCGSHTPPPKPGGTS